MNNINLRTRLANITYKYHLSHLSSTLSALPIIEEIYERKSINDLFVLSSGHAGLALYVVNEKFHNINAEEMFEKHGIHPGYDPEHYLFSSSGSLGSGICIAVGYALSNRNRQVYCLVSDGETAEGSFWEAIRFIHEQKLTNCHVYVNINGQGAISYIDREYLKTRLLAFLPNINIRESEYLKFKFAEGLKLHYQVMNEENFQEVLGA